MYISKERDSFPELKVNPIKRKPNFVVCFEIVNATLIKSKAEGSLLKTSLLKKMTSVLKLQI